MGRLAVVVSTKRLVVEGSQVVELVVDTGGGNTVTVDHFDGAGEDALPLPGDLIALEEGDGAGNLLAVAYHDSKNAGTAAEGERRTYARGPDGAVVAEIWAKGSGDIKIRSIKAGGKIDLNGFVIDQQGNASTPGEVTAMAATPATSVTLSRHTHLTGTGPSSPATPGT
jgi:hypothetical protein